MDRLKNNKGVFSISLLFVNLSLISLGYLLFFLLGQFEHQSFLRKSCLDIFLPLHRQLNQKIDALFRLNPRSTQLKIEHERLQFQLKAAMALGNAQAISVLMIRIQIVTQQRLQLDLQQKQIISSAAILIQSRQQTFTNLLNRKMNAYQKKTDIFQNFIPLYIESYPSTFAVRPASFDLAPNYELSPNFSKLQRTHFQWQAQWIAKTSTQNFQKFNFKSSEICEIYPSREGTQWKIKINMDKWLSKGSSPSLF